MLNVLIEVPEWREVALETLAEQAVAQTLGHMGLAECDVEISLLACDDRRILELNADFRGKDTATNVLSWPSADLSARSDGTLPDAPEPGFDGIIELGDIAISYETCARESLQAQKPMHAHTTHLIVHGTLHLLGYDHIRDRDATLMQALEIEILGKMGLDDPYRC